MTASVSFRILPCLQLLTVYLQTFRVWITVRLCMCNKGSGADRIRVDEMVSLHGAAFMLVHPPLRNFILHRRAIARLDYAFGRTTCGANLAKSQWEGTSYTAAWPVSIYLQRGCTLITRWRKMLTVCQLTNTEVCNPYDILGRSKKMIRRIRNFTGGIKLPFSWWPS